MPNTVVFLWISAGGLVFPAAAELDLRDFGAARGIDFRPPAARSRGATELPANDAALVDAIEAELEQARTALSALEEGAASARLSRVEGQLLSHSHLPQAAFLMGECLALQAQAARERSPALAQSLEARRAALEGTRAAAFGEAPLASPAPPLAPLPVLGLAERDMLEVDGVSVGASRRVELGAGLHHVRVLRRERVVFASFTEVAPEQETLVLAAPTLQPCSAEDLSAVAEAASVACPRWAKVREEPRGIGVALCEHERCGAFVHWQRSSPSPFAPLPAERRGLPGWLGFAIAGATVAAAGTLVLWQSGAFDRSRPNAATWEYGGLNPQGVRF
ncbi:MAG: hypothetical protein EOO73_18625 [Myxococcales bacterium]|nr:MAG: hypothetical protein EOO73_18625 [Myxococcales bacterium]